MFVFELTRDYNAILPLMLATVVAMLIATAVMRESIMTEKLSRRGLRVPSGYHADVLHTTLVGDVMTKDVVTVPADASVREVATRFRTNGHGAYPIVDARGHCVGIVSRSDLLLDGSELPDGPVESIAARDVVSVSPADSLDDALQRMLQEDVEHLPVIEDGALVGMCTRTDILGARRTQFAHEHTEPGWRPRRRR